ncbi:hypothetical protein [Solemya velum gill symbiont]|uniref:Uncharacterized protein n=2 Tax=Solemya velum gill symbiont TaxID=2340 RepID=A0A1T2JFA6_SOVGS|nr:hypothetical protein [Solemya velum gill symbiont]OOY35258.1 hypothetical protein BOV88_05935 [Solemya velum gill symbiont]OOY37959.1 hypothetical protein BOV89_04850 [Solemya velum gill symbiont]OOY42382.1 hypothetical protein BOV91_07160 [Solemya velum gill symbiont]OOY44987.1 hypothetical protein BOV92_07180 [Solemya velum gill symbiont]OOY48237.1 hypothetical protein BOV93_03805 [Solemya velum gill symbiont]
MRKTVIQSISVAALIMISGQTAAQPYYQPAYPTYGERPTPEYAYPPAYAQNPYPRERRWSMWRDGWDFDRRTKPWEGDYWDGRDRWGNRSDWGPFEGVVDGSGAGDFDFNISAEIEFDVDANADVDGDSDAGSHVYHYNYNYYYQEPGYSDYPPPPPAYSYYPPAEYYPPMEYYPPEYGYPQPR